MRIDATTLLLCIAAAYPGEGALAWSVTSSSTNAAVTTTTTPSSSVEVSRRQAWGQAFKASAAVIVPSLLSTGMAMPAMALPDEETPRVTTRMGGLLEAFQDGGRGVRIMAPSGWNKFDGEVGAYDIKWQDVVDPAENVKISSSPVKSTTESVQVLGDVQELGKSLASKRNARLVRASERLTDGILFYLFEFAINDGTHQILQLCVCKGKLWSLDANAKESRWSKRAELYENVVGSFMPKLS